MTRHDWNIRHVSMLLALAAAANSPVGAADSRGRPASAILISIDSLRADHLPFHGYPRMTAPFLDRLVSRPGTQVFERATAVSPSCHPSHVTMLSGLYPQQVGVPLCPADLTVKHSDFSLEENIAALEAYQRDLKSRPEPLGKTRQSAVMNSMRIPEDTPTLATWFQQRGYRTGAFVSIWTLYQRYGYGRGFEQYVDSMSRYYGPRGLAWLLRDRLKSQRREDGAVTLARALEFLDQVDEEEPFFLFLHFGDTHVPYGAPPEIALPEADSGARHRLEATWRARYPGRRWRRARKRMHSDGEFVLDSYDRSILYVDGLLARLFDRLADRGRLDDTAFVITSDHGDSFGQHTWLSSGRESQLFFEHSVQVWEETQHVPLIVVDPSGDSPAARRLVNASHVDIAPTLMALAGGERSGSGAGDPPGRDLFSLPEEDRTVFFMTFGRGRPGLLQGLATDYPQFLGFRTGNTKFFVDKARLRKQREGRCFLFDLEADPHEMENLCEERKWQERAVRYRAVVVDWWNRSTSPRREPAAVREGAAPPERR